MATKPKKWPTNALGALEDVLVLLGDIGRLSREAQVRATEGDFARVVILNGDVREKAIKATHLLVQARTGQGISDP